MKDFRGIYGIMTAPYKANYDLDVEDIRREAEFCVRAGAHGIVVPVNASEFFLLSEEERNLFVRETVEATAGRVPVIAGVAATTTQGAVAFARHAKTVGADGVIAMPPYIMKATSQEIVDYYRAIAEACELPVFIQNYVAPVGTPMSAELCCRIIGEVDGVNYVKEETEMSGHMISQINAFCQELPKGRYKGTMGGKACRYLIDEYRRGACGCMPACEIVDVMSEVWNRLDAGEQAAAEVLYEKAIPLLNMEYMFGYSIYKEVLRRRGIIKLSINRRPGGHNLDELDHVELDRIMKPLSQYFKV